MEDANTGLVTYPFSIGCVGRVGNEQTDSPARLNGDVASVADATELDYSHLNLAGLPGAMVRLTYELMR